MTITKWLPRASTPAATILALAAAGAFIVSTDARAQAAPQPSPKAESDVKKIEKLTVTASPLDRADNELAQSATVLTQEDLRRKRAASLGDTLSQEVGVQSSAFGPAAGRPIIRGMDGPRIRVLENGIGTMDVSTVSPDHMVTTESLHADQIEILRGPASLLYGSGAIGGVVNVVSNLIPRKRAEGPLTGDAEARFSSGNNERTGSANLNGGAGDFAWHLDGFTRKTRDYDIPGHAVRGDDTSASGRLPDSAVDSKGGGAGASWVIDRGYLGAGVEGLESTYGIPSGEGSHIHMRQTKFETSGEINDPMRGISRFRFRLGHNDYQHEEIEESGAVATTFKQKATEGRFELGHGAIGGVTGTIGLQLQNRDMSALGDEALFPKTRSRATGVFIVEQKDLGAWILDAGVRFERETRRPTVEAEDVEKFGSAINRDFNLVSPSVGVVWKFAQGHNLAVSLTQAQRAPATEELYSNGLHGATSTFELGNPNLRKEVADNLDVSLRKTDGEVRWKLGAFASRFKDYIFPASVDANGDGIADRVNAEGVLDPTGEFLVQNYSQADARFRGLEAEISYRPDGRDMGIRLFGDLVRAKLNDGTNLPRIAPARLGVTLDARQDRWSEYLTTIHAFSQKRTAPLETDTSGYTRVDAELAYQIESAKGRTLTIFLQGTNLLDREIRLHTSYLKDVAPLMGRSVTLGFRGEF
jgi:iron complex outermembrane receptor protein